jgi:hypothetical protein
LYAKNITKQEVIDELIRLQNEGHSMKIGEFEHRLKYGLTKHFGGYKNAKKELGISSNKQGYFSEKRLEANERKVIWTDELIKTELNHLLSLGITRNEMRDLNPKLFTAIDRKFKSFDDCGDYYGLKVPNKNKNVKYTDAEVDEFIVNSSREGKSSHYLKSVSGDEIDRRMYGAALRRYGSWNKALEANGITPNNVKRRFMSKEELAYTYKQDLEKGVNRGDIRYRHHIEKYFGSAKNLEKHLGIFIESDEETLMIYEKSLLDEKVYEIHSKEFEKISTEILNNFDRNIVFSIKHHYGSVTDYFSQLDVDYYSKPYVPFRWDAENTKRQLLRWIREGKPVNYTAIAHRHKGLIVAARKYYGNYEGLFSACGLDYDEYRTDTTLASFYGRALEDVFENILSDLEIKYVRQPEINDCHPDFVSGRTWYDAKLSEWTINFADCITVKKYEPHCDSLIIVFLRGNKDTDKRLTEKTRLVNIYKYVDMLPSEKRSKYINALEEIESNVNSNELGSQSDNKTA